MAEKCCIIGAGGHMRSLQNLLYGQGFNPVEIFDETYKPDADESILGIPVVGSPESIPKDLRIALALGNNEKRSYYFEKFKRQIIQGNLIHSSCFIEKWVKLGHSNQIFAGVYLNSNVKIGQNNIINSRALIEHDTKIGDHNHVSIGAILAGNVVIGSHCFIGAGAIVADKIKICDNVTIGANSFVNHDIISPGAYVGNPAKRLK